MFEYLPSDATLFESSFEILIILAGTFFLGMMFGWLIKPVSKIKNYTEASKLNSLQEKKIFEKDDDEIFEEIVTGDITLIIGIDSKIKKLLALKGVHNFADIVRLDVAGLEQILLEAGNGYTNYIPTTWPDQARLASLGKWTELEEYQEILSHSNQKKQH
ncbi:hypothetical protein GW846_05795 [Candidatus Gracilibacteria bacterium]|nr:hypothetical protein [Candidatus Gracilibacteria bacterium]